MKKLTPLECININDIDMKFEELKQCDKRLESIRATLQAKQNTLYVVDIANPENFDYYVMLMDNTRRLLQRYQTVLAERECIKEDIRRLNVNE